MLKKVLLYVVIISALVTIQDVQALSLDKVKKSISGFDRAVNVCSAIVGTSLVTATYIYARRREANSTVVDKVNRLFRHVSENVSKVRPEGFSQLVLVFKEFDVFAFELHAEMQYRYSSWIAPWNWSGSMKQAYLRATLLNIMFKYLDIIASWHSNISDRVMLQLAEKVVCGQGVMTNFIDCLNEDIQTVDSVAKDVTCNFSTILQSHLMAIRDMALCSSAYVQERSLFV